MKLKATKEKKDLLPVPCLGPQAGPDSHLLPQCGVQGRHAPQQILAEIVFNFHLDFDPNRKSSIASEKRGCLQIVEN